MCPKTDLYTKLAKMQLYKVSDSEQAAASGLSIEQILVVRGEEMYGEIYSEIAAEIFNRQEILNDGWDAIEAKSLEQIYDELEHNPDPLFALKAAQVSNKATRRSHSANMPLEGQVGLRAVIQLNATFVEKLEQQFTVNKLRVTPAQLQQKDENYLNPAMLENTLGLEETEATELVKAESARVEDVESLTRTVDG